MVPAATHNTRTPTPQKTSRRFTVNDPPHSHSEASRSIQCSHSPHRSLANSRLGWLRRNYLGTPERQGCKESETTGNEPAGCSTRPSSLFVGCLVYLVCLVHRVGLVQPNEQDKPNRPNKPDRPNVPRPSRLGRTNSLGPIPASCLPRCTTDGRAVEKRCDPSQMGRQSRRADRRASGTVAYHELRRHRVEYSRAYPDQCPQTPLRAF